jgi:hypothetical protein
MFAYVVFAGVLAIALNGCLLLAARRLIPGHVHGTPGHA